MLDITHTYIEYVVNSFFTYTYIQVAYKIGYSYLHMNFAMKSHFKRTCIQVVRCYLQCTLYIYVFCNSSPSYFFSFCQFLIFNDKTMKRLID